MTEELESELDLAQVGRILHVVMDNGRCRPAIVVFTHHKIGLINVQVFNGESTSHLELVHPSHKTKVRRTWHWPKECIRTRDSNNVTE